MILKLMPNLQNLFPDIVSSPEESTIDVSEGSNDNNGDGDGNEDEDEDEDCEGDFSLLQLRELRKENPFNPQSNWTLRNGENVSSVLTRGAVNFLTQNPYSKMTGEQRYAISLSLSGILDISCDFQLHTILNLANKSDLENFKHQATKLLDVQILLLELSVDEDAVIERIHELLECDDFIKIGSLQHEFRIALEIYEHVLLFFKRDPLVFSRPHTEPKSSETESLLLISPILSILFSGMNVTVRVGELIASNVIGTRRKVDLIMMKKDIQCSHSEFARSPSDKTKKWWNDRSKILRLNQIIYNNLRNCSTFQSVAFNLMVRLNGNLIVLDHVDHGIYLADTRNKFKFPSRLEEIDEFMPELLSNLFYFKHYLELKETKASKRTTKEKTQKKDDKELLIPINPVWTNRKTQKLVISE
ncbi:hypothetical protein HK096_009149 [Nowakowskiella sp. JEL0078]|nr:hypothetical protein HK096_009149 [Nowakowskiella sp. JEL0078]